MVSEFVLLDTNLLIGAFDHDKDNPKHVEARSIVVELMRDKSKIIAITPLIRYEVLRGVKHIAVEDMQDILDDFAEFEITDIEGNKAAEIYRIAKCEDIKLDKRSFDVFHYVVAKVRDLDWQSYDKDWTQIDSLCQKYKLSFN